MDKSKLQRLTPKASERARPIVMVVLLIMVVSLYFYVELTGPRTQYSAPEDSIRPRLEANAPPAANIRPELLAGVRDATAAQQAVLEKPALAHLLSESGKLVAGDFRRMDTRNLDAEALYEQVLADPAPERGKPFSVRGLFSFTEPKEVPMTFEGGGTQVEGTLPYYCGLVQDLSGRQFSFSVLEEPNDIEPGQIVRLRGFLLKKATVYDPAERDRPIENTLHLVGKRVVPSFLRMDPVTEISPALMSTIRDYELDDQLSIPEEPLFHALSFVMNADPKELSAHAEDYTTFQLRTNPQQYRGERVRVLGTFFETWPQHLGIGGENPLDLAEVWHGLLVHSGPSFTYLILPERQPEWVENGDTVIAEGVFLKRHTYQARNGEAVSSPLIVVKRFVRYKVSAESVNLVVVAAVCMMVAIGLFGWFLLSVFGDRKANRVFRDRYYERRRKLVQNLETKAAEESP